jgi:hypothetical protein
MTENELRQDFFISDNGYINIRLKVTTEDKIEREKIVVDLMNRLYNKEGFELHKNTVVDQLYFQNQNPLSVLNNLKDEMLEKINSTFDDCINRLK